MMNLNLAKSGQNKPGSGPRTTKKPANDVKNSRIYKIFMMDKRCFNFECNGYIDGYSINKRIDTNKRLTKYYFCRPCMRPFVKGKIRFIRCRHCNSKTILGFDRNSVCTECKKNTLYHNTKKRQLNPLWRDFVNEIAESQAVGMNICPNFFQGFFRVF